MLNVNLSVHFPLRNFALFYFFAFSFLLRRLDFLFLANHKIDFWDSMLLFEVKFSITSPNLTPYNFNSPSTHSSLSNTLKHFTALRWFFPNTKMWIIWQYTLNSLFFFCLTQFTCCAFHSAVWINSGELTWGTLTNFDSLMECDHLGEQSQLLTFLLEKHGVDMFNILWHFLWVL